MQDDLISRQATIDALREIMFSYWFECGEYIGEDQREMQIINAKKALETISALPSAQPEPSIEVKDILDFLDTELHPVISPERWDIYSNLYDMVAGLSLAQPEQKWTPCSKQLPDEDTDVLVTVHFKGLKQRHKNGWNDHIKPSYYVEVASLLDDDWHSYSDEYKVARSRHEVIAWQPLPDPYIQEEEQ